MFNKTLEILKNTMYITKIYIFAISAAILNLENSHYFLNISVITHWIHEHSNVHFGTADTHSPMLEITINTQANCHLAAILDFYDNSMKKNNIFLNRRSFCNVYTRDKIKCNNCVFVFSLKSKMSDLVIYWPPFWIFPAISNSCLNKIIINRLSYIDAIYSSEKIILLC